MVEDLDYHKHFPTGGVGKQYEWLLEQMRDGGFGAQSSILDYGCGQGGTALWLESLHPGLSITRYDPYVPRYNNFRNQFYDWIYTADVLEHIPESELENTIKIINSCARGRTDHIIDLDPAKKVLPDGRNAHLSLLSPDVWIQLFETKMSVTFTKVAEYPDKHTGKRRRLHITATRGKKM